MNAQVGPAITFALEPAQRVEDSGHPLGKGIFPGPRPGLFPRHQPCLNSARFEILLPTCPRAEEQLQILQNLKGFHYVRYETHNEGNLS